MLTVTESVPGLKTNLALEKDGEGLPTTANREAHPFTRESSPSSETS
jgi:hypothetical protein